MKYLNRKLKSIMLSGLLSMGIVTANYAMFNKEVVLIVDGQEIEVNSSQSNVQGVLDENEDFEGADENYDYSLRYDDFIAPLVAYCQNLKKKNTELENKLNKIYEKLGLSD